MKEIFDDRMTEWFCLKIGNSIVKLHDDEGVDDYDRAKSISKKPSHFGVFFIT